jgi:hypothetical protein
MWDWLENVERVLPQREKPMSKGCGCLPPVKVGPTAMHACQDDGPGSPTLHFVEKCPGEKKGCDGVSDEKDESATFLSTQEGNAAL